MLSLSLARQLKEAGLEWQPALNDFFAIPDRGFDDEIFVISDVFANVEWLQGHLSVTFHGAVEWALDQVMVAELIWLPSEGQLREELEKRLAQKGPFQMRLIGTATGHVCEFDLGTQQWRFEASDASAAYAAALLHVLTEGVRREYLQ
jgi:hypothetical protein